MAACISVLAFEQLPWLRILMRNALDFSEANTRVVMHLNVDTAYSNQTMASLARHALLANGRLSITPGRLGVSRASVTILLAHLLNVVHMDTAWPNHCQYAVLQASNMLWVRRGWEASVRQLRCSASPAPLAANAATRKVRSVPFYQTISPHVDRGRHGFAYHEGSFYPLSVLRAFIGHFEKNAEWTTSRWSHLKSSTPTWTNPQTTLLAALTAEAASSPPAQRKLTLMLQAWTKPLLYPEEVLLPTWSLQRAECEPLRPRPWDAQDWQLCWRSRDEIYLAQST